jgi:hypothetical protein
MEHDITGHGDSYPTMKCGHCCGRSNYFEAFPPSFSNAKAMTYIWEVHNSKLDYLSWLSSILPSKCLECIGTYIRHTNGISGIFISEYPRNNCQEPRGTLNITYVPANITVFRIQESQLSILCRRRTVMRQRENFQPWRESNNDSEKFRSLALLSYGFR